MIRAEIFMTDGDKESVREIKNCDFILTLGFQYGEGGMKLHTGIHGTSEKGLVEELARGMVESLKRIGKGRAGKTVVLLKFKEAFEEAAKEEVWKMITEAAEEGADEEGEEEDGEIPV